MSLFHTPIPDRRASDRVVGIVAEAFDLAPSMLRIRSQEHHIARPRQIVFWLLRQRNWAYTRIGQAMGGYNHTTVLHGICGVERQRQHDPSYRDFTNELQARVYRADEAAREAARVKPLGRVDVLETRIAMLEAMFAVSGRQRTW